MKRAFDIVASLIGLAIFGLILPIVAVIIKIDSKGGVFYSQWRVGINRRKEHFKIFLPERRRVFLPGKVFKIYKLRTMRIDAEEFGKPIRTIDCDPRVTRVGKILRKTHVDELPQLWNVLKGDMSLVGPRPERPLLVKFFLKNIENYRLRHKVLPGIAGLAQTKGNFYGLSVETEEEKLNYDIEYIRSSPNLIGDILILIKTLGRIKIK